MRISFPRLISQFKDRSGQRINRWTFLNFDRRENNKTYWKVRCVCGFEAIRDASAIAGGLSKSCGCLHIEIVKRKGHGFVRHGMSRTKVHRAWKDMRNRCYNPNVASYKYYGAIGIKVHPKWISSFEEFYADVGDPPSKHHSLDRINVLKNYEPGNVKWSTKTEQANNKRNNRYIEWDGRKQSLSQWARELGLNAKIISKKFHRGIRPPELFHDDKLPEDCIFEFPD